MTRHDARKKLFQSLGACFLAFVMILTNVLGAVEVQAAGIEAPTITKAFIGTNTISGGNLHRGKIDGKPARGTVHVTLKNGDTVKAELSVTPKSGKDWTVKLPDGVTIAEGDTVTAYQEFDGQNSPKTTANAMESLAKQNKDKLKMPTGEIWIENTSSNLVNENEQAEAVEMFNNVNTEIAGDIKSVKFSIDGTDHAYYEATYTDGSTSGKVEATNLQIKQVTETSRGASLESITVTANEIKGKLAGEGPFNNTKIQLILKVNDADKPKFCNDKCALDKNSGKPVDATLDSQTGEFTYTIKPTDRIELGNVVGVIVKEKNKFQNCSSKKTVTLATPSKTEVRDPRKLTDEDKKAIDKAIRDANTVNGTSKLPNGTGFYDGIPAFIEFDKDGNARIIDPSNVEGDWVTESNFVPRKNDDGSLKVTNESAVIKIPAKDLVKNIKPEKPAVALSEDKKSITITPNLKVDTDAHIITVSYKDKDGNDQTTTATKADDGTWSIAGEGTVVNGVITLSKDKVKSGTDVKATVIDKGGIADDDTAPLTSDPGTLALEETKAEKVEALGGLDPVDIKKWVGDEIKEGFWKDGVKAKDSAKETEVNKLLAGSTFTDETETKRSTEKSGEFVGKIKVTFDDGSELVVDKQKLMVCDHVTSTTDPKLPNDALDVQFKLGEGVKVEDKDPNTGEVTKTTKGDKNSPVLYKEYKVKPGTDLSTYKHPTLKKTIFDLIDEKADEGYTEPVWKGQDADDANNFVAAAGNSVFTATATKTFKVTVKPNGGTGDEKVEIKKKDETFKLPAANTFTPPNDNQEFSGWKIGDDTNLKQPGTEITISGDTEINAIWKPIEFKVDFKAGEGASGSMEDKTVTKGSEYELPTPTFTAPKDKVFAGWKVGDQEGVKQAGAKIDIKDNVTLTATWKDIEYKVTFNGSEGTGSMDEKLVKKGNEYTLPENGFTAPANKEFDGWMVGTEKKAVGDTITVNGDTEVKAVWKDIKHKVTFNGTEGSGSMDEKVVKQGDEYTLPENGFTAPKNKEFAGWKVGNEDKKPGDKITVNGDTEVKAVWKDIEHKVTFNGTEGSGKMDEKVVKQEDEYTLPENGFTAPEGKQFDGWMVGTEKKSVGDKIVINSDTEVKAIWKDIEYKITFEGNGGAGSMNPETVKKGKKFKLPENGFTAPEGKEFAGWQISLIPKKQFDPGTEVKVTGNTVVKAIWKDVPSKPDAPRWNDSPGFVFPRSEAKEMEIGRHYRYLYGYTDKTVRPEGNITRAEAAALIARLAGLDMSDDSKPNFADTPSAWYNSAINIAVKMDLMFADKDGNFRPNEPITRAEFARALYYVDKKNDTVAPFADVKGHVYEDAINQAYGNGRISGYPDGTFRPDAKIQRAEVARILNQYANRGTTLEGMAGVAKDLIQFTDITPSHWAYCEVMEAANNHEYEREKGTQTETWLRILPLDLKIAK